MKNKFLLTLLFVFVALHGFCIDEVCDLDGDGIISSSDTAIFAAWLQTRKSSDISVVQTRARAFVATVVVVRLPGLSDKLVDSSDTLGSTDLAFLVAFLQTRQSTDFSLVEGRANAILGQSLALSKLPGITIGDSTVPVTITGIQLD